MEECNTCRKVVGSDEFCMNDEAYSRRMLLICRSRLQDEEIAEVSKLFKLANRLLER